MMWTDRVDGKCCVVVSFAVSVELLWTDRIDGECCVLLWTDGDSADEVVVPHNSSKSMSDSDRSNATLRVTCDDVIVSGFGFCRIVWLWRGSLNQ